MKRNFNQILKKLIVINIIILFIVSFATVSFSESGTQLVTFSFKSTPKIDIILAKQRTATDVTNFEKDMLDAIKEQGINTKLVQISSVQAETIDITETFSWEKDVSSSIGSITISPDGKDVTMIGNKVNPGKNAIWIIPGENQEQEFNFSYDINYGDSFNAAGMLLRVQKTGNVLQGYMLSFNNTAGSNWNGAAGNCNGAIWEFNYTIGANGTNMTKTLKQGLTINKSGTLNVKVDDNQIVVSGGGLSNTVTYVLPNSFGNGYGFFSDHYSHNCDSIGSFALTGINLEATTVRKFTEVLREPTWRDDALKILLNVSDVINEELNTETGQAELSTRLLNENINYVAWGKDVNKEQYDRLIASNNGNGKFINNQTYTNTITEMAEYIKELVNKLEPKEDYLLLNEPIAITAEPNDILKDTIDEEWPYGKWKIVHDYTYYENNLGQFSETNKYISDMIEGFNKTGKYTITYKDEVISPKDIYVHRKPVAVIGMTKNENNVTFTSNSYDLDLYSREDKGIEEEEWKYKRVQDTNWTNGKLERLEEDTVYLVQLTVKDYQKTWSDPASLYVTTKSNNETVPIASFQIKRDVITKYEELEVVDTSYDPAGKEITSRKWEVFKDGNSIYSGDTPLTTYSSTGTYTMKLTVKNSSNAISEVYSRQFKVELDKTPPEVIANPVSCDWKKGEEVNISIIDDGGSGLKSYKYAITDSQSEPTSWSAEIAKSKDIIKIEKEGKNYLHIIATDNDGNISQDRIFGEYFIDKTGPNIKMEIDTENTKIDNLVAEISAEDIYSGVKSLKINGVEIENSLVRFSKNGIYQVEAEDNIGNTSTENIEIDNIYYECKAELNHPIYSSNYDSCPICEGIELQITNEECIYDGEEHKVEYENLQDAEIVEYYNGTRNLPKSAGEYNYELKITYGNTEYETGIKGVYVVNKREVEYEGLKAKDKKYDRSKIVELVEGKLVNTIEGDNIEAIVPKTGEAESEKQGKWKVKIDDIELIGEDAANYTMKQLEYGSIMVEIIKPSEPLMKVSSSIYGINEKEIKEDSKEEKLIHNDIAKIKAVIINEGEGSGYVSSIKTKLPDGVELLENSKINEQNKWKKNDKGELEIDEYSMEKSFESELIGKNQNENVEKNTKNENEKIEVELEVRINNTKKEDEILPIEFQIQQQDKNGDIVEYEKENIENSKDKVILNKKYFDASIKSKIKQLKLIKDGKEEDVKIKNELVKLEIPEKEINNTKLEVIYEIEVKNEGTIDGEIQKIVDTLPEGLTFYAEDNLDWKVDEKGKVSYIKNIVLKEKEDKAINLILKSDLKNNNIGVRNNIVTLDAKDDIDQILIKEGIIKLEKTNNITYSEMIITLKTGIENVMPILILTSVCLGIFVIGVYLIKKYAI